MEKVEAKAKVEGEDSVWEGPGLPQSSDKYTIIYMPRDPYISLSYLSLPMDNFASTKVVDAAQLLPIT